MNFDFLGESSVIDLEGEARVEGSEPKPKASCERKTTIAVIGVTENPDPST
jgi:hypothetical protein